MNESNINSPGDKKNAAKTNSIDFKKFVEVDIPIRLKSLANETSEHWSSRMKRNKSHSYAVAAYLRPHISSLKLPCRITFIRIAPRFFDDDNLIISFKSIRDTIAQLFFPETQRGKADSYDCFEWRYDQIKAGSKEYLVRIRIEEIDQVTMDFWCGNSVIPVPKSQI